MLSSGRFGRNVAVFIIKRIGNMRFLAFRKIVPICLWGPVRFQRRGTFKRKSQSAESGQSDPGRRTLNPVRHPLRMGATNVINLSITEKGIWMRKFAGFLIVVFGAVSSDRTVSAEPGWSPVIIATGAYRQQIESTPIELRPYRPFHIYGNTVRRNYYRGNPLPLPRGEGPTIIAPLATGTRGPLFRGF